MIGWCDMTWSDAETGLYMTWLSVCMQKSGSTRGGVRRPAYLFTVHVEDRKEPFTWWYIIKTSMFIRFPNWTLICFTAVSRTTIFHNHLYSCYEQLEMESSELTFRSIYPENKPIWWATLEGFLGFLGFFLFQILLNSFKNKYSTNS